MTDIYQDHEIKIVCNEAALRELIRILKCLQALGSIGSSRSVKIDKFEAFFDGDGADRIKSIKVNNIDLITINQITEDMARGYLESRQEDEPQCHNECDNVS